MSKPINKFIVSIINTKWQLVFCGVIIFVFAVISHYSSAGNFNFSEIQFNSLSNFLLGITFILVLATTLSAGYLLAFIQFTNSRRFDLYGKFKAEINSFFQYLERLENDSDLVMATKASLWEIDKILFRDFPIMNWDDLISPFMTEMNKDDVDHHDPNLPNWLARRVRYIEELVSEIGIMCVRQALTSIFLGTVLKSLFLLLFSIAIGTVLAFWPTLLNVILVQTIILLLSILTILLFAEIGYRIYRDVREHVSEVTEAEEKSDQE